MESRNHVVVKFLLQDPEWYKDTQMKAYDITELTAELKSDNVQYRNKTAVVLFWYRRSIATGSSALTTYLDLLGIGKLHPLHERKKIAKSLKFAQDHSKLHR